LARVAQYSGKYRPAWRMSQTGVWSVAWRRQARRKLSFCKGAKELMPLLWQAQAGV
jgi:hypothetical protein